MKFEKKEITSAEYFEYKARKPKNSVYIATYIPAEMRIKLQKYLDKNNMTLSKWLRRAVMELVIEMD